MKASGKTPIPTNVQPMLATLASKPFDSPDWLFELKMDGIRALVIKDGDRFEMRTRNDKPLTNRFPTLAAALKEVPGDAVILDGEIVALDSEGHSHLPWFGFSRWERVGVSAAKVFRQQALPLAPARRLCLGAYAPAVVR